MITIIVLQNKEGVHWYNAVQGSISKDDRSVVVDMYHDSECSIKFVEVGGANGGDDLGKMFSDSQTVDPKCAARPAKIQW